MKKFLLLFLAICLIVTGFACTDTAKSHIDKGNKLYDQEKWDEAIVEYTKALEKEPNNVMALTNRGSAYTEKGMYNEAIADLSKAVELEPENVLPYYNRSQAFIRMGDYDKAIEDCNKIIELGLEFHWNYYNRGVAYSRKGREYFGKAISDFETAKKLTTNKEFHDRANEAIKQIEEALKSG